MKFLVLSLFLLPLFSTSITHASKCGEDGHKICKAKKAKKHGKAKKGCGKHRFFDPIDGGTCWSCPKGTNRTIFPVTAKNACEKPGETKEKKKWKKAKKHGRPGCKKDQFHDPIDGGTCWSCPKYYSRSISSVKSKTACTPNDPCKHTGMIVHRNKCYKLNTGKCGHKKQRPCIILEKEYKNVTITGCRKGLKVQKGICTKLEKGDTETSAFFSSLGDGFTEINGMCKRSIENIPTFELGIREFDVSSECTKFFSAGLTCEALTGGDAVVGRALTGFSNLFKDPSESEKSTIKVQFYKAKRHKKAHFFDCPDGQFYDPIHGGTCWSCPGHSVRSVETVEGKRACTTGPLATAMLSLGLGQVENAKCIKRALEKGIFFKDREKAKVSFKYTPKICEWTGQLIYKLGFNIQNKKKSAKKKGKKASKTDLAKAAAGPIGAYAFKISKQFSVKDNPIESIVEDLRKIKDCRYTVP